MEIIYAFVGLVIGAVITFFIVNKKTAVASAMLETEKETHKNDVDSLNRQLDSAKQEGENRLKEAQLQAEERLSQQKKESLDQQELTKKGYDDAIRFERAAAAEALDKQKQEHQQALAQVKKEAEDRLQEELRRMKETTEKNLELVKQQVTTTTEELLKKRGEELQNSNNLQMDSILKPLKENIENMQKSIKEDRESHIATSERLKTTMENMMKTTENLGVQADRLSNALQRENKTAGNWGELILSELLCSQGLQEGVHFDVQQTLRDEEGNTLKNEETGKRMIPDVILHLDETRDVIVDSKMSLTAFVDYQNATNEEERAAALERHILSVKSHIKELTSKNYQGYIKKPRVSADFVIMFVPIEGALQLALTHAPELWREAFDKKVFIAGGQTLIAALRIIDLTWVNIKQERNTEKILDEARKLVDRVGQFYDKFQTVGKRIQEANNAYCDVVDKVKEGQQSILKAGRNLEELGVRGKKALPNPEEE